MCMRIKGAAGDEDEDNVIVCERWRIVRRFISTFLAGPVVGVFTCCDKAGVQTLALALVEGMPQREWELLTRPVEAVSLAWPFLFQVGEDLDGDVELGRAIGEVLLFDIDADARMEALWWEHASTEQKEYAKMWEETDRDKYIAWEQEKGIKRPSARVAEPSPVERAGGDAGGGAALRQWFSFSGPCAPVHHRLEGGWSAQKEGGAEAPEGTDQASGYPECEATTRQGRVWLQGA